MVFSIFAFKKNILSNRNKLGRFADLETFPNVYQCFDAKKPELVGVNREPIDLKGKWKLLHFKNENPITLELACGGGEYTLNLARQYPNRNFIGVDIKGARIWKGARVALRENLANVAFLRTQIERIAYFFDKDEIDEIWITFPDPFLKESKSNRRLTASYFLDEYRKILVPQGIVQLKTDSKELYDFTLEVLGEDQKTNLLYYENDIYAKPLEFPELEIKTHYELMHLAEGRKIKFIRFIL